MLMRKVALDFILEEEKRILLDDAVKEDAYFEDEVGEDALHLIIIYVLLLEKKVRTK
jgi:hypothetical protein